MNIKHLILFVLLTGLLAGNPSYASFEKDTARLNQILRFVPENLYNDKGQTLKLINEGLEITAWEGLEQEKAYLLNQLGIYHYLEANYKKAADVFSEAIWLNYQYQRYADLIDNYNNKGNVFQAIGNYKVALRNFQAAEEIVDSLKLYTKKPITLTNLGKVHRLIGNPFSAIQYFEKASKYAIKEGQGVELANAYHNLGETYADLKEWTNAGLFYQKVIALAEDGSIPFDPTNTYAEMANTLRKQGLVKQSLFFHQKVYEATKAKEYRVGMIESLIGIGDCYLKLGELQKAERYFVEGIYEATAFERNDVIGDGYYRLAEVYEKQGKLKQALYVTRVGAHLEDSLKSAEMHRQLVEMQTMYQSEKQQREYANMAKENLVHQARIENKTIAIVFMSVLMILLVLLVILYNNFARVRAENNKILEKLVGERTVQLQRKEKILSAQNKKLMTYAHMTSHSLRKPLANILGVVNWIEADKIEAVKNKEEIYEVIKQSAYELDETIIDSMNVLNEEFIVEEEEIESNEHIELPISNSGKTIPAV